MSQLLIDVVRAGFGKQNDVIIDTQILRVHSRLSFRIFVISSVLLTFKQLIGGDDISCIEDNTIKTKDENLNAFCWIQSTYSVVELFHSCSVYNDCLYPGVGKVDTHTTTKFHKYYQWTSAVLFLQAVLFYVPRFAWKCVENGLQKTLACDRKFLFYPITSVDDTNTHLQHLVTYFKFHRGHHQFYFTKYVLCELLGVVVVCFNIIISDFLLDHQFFNYGSDVFRYWTNGEIEEVNPMVKVFPLVAKCTPPKRFGPGGSIISPDPVCVLPLNSLNDKIFLFLWFYLFAALFISVLGILHRLFTMLSINVRMILLNHCMGGLKGAIHYDICKKFFIGDWFVMYIMNNNVSNEFFVKFLELLRKEMFEKDLSV